MQLRVVLAGNINYSHTNVSEIAEKLKIVNALLKGNDIPEEKPVKKEPPKQPERLNDFLLATRYLNKLKNAESRGIPFELTIDEYDKICSGTRCYYTGKRFSDDQNSATYKTLDRKDASKGYTKENTVVCCHGINQLKNALFERNSDNNISLTKKQLLSFLNKVQL